MTQYSLRCLLGMTTSTAIIPLNRDGIFAVALRPGHLLNGFYAAAVFDYGYGNFEIIVARHCEVIARHVRAHPGLVCRCYQRW